MSEISKKISTSYNTVLIKEKVEKCIEDIFNYYPSREYEKAEEYEAAKKIFLIDLS
jgi:hypothetical protein